MEKFIFFNQRLTDKLNLIYRYPFTVVTGGSGVGKTFAVRNYLATTKGEVIWHVIKEGEFSSYIRDFATNLAAWGVSSDAFRAATEETAAPAELAVRFAAVLKQSVLSGRKVYVLEYMGDKKPEEILEFLFYLAAQYVDGVHVLLSLRQQDTLKEKEFLDVNVNYIPEDCFLLRPKEIRHAWKRNGIELGSEETAFLSLCTGGYLPMIRIVLDEMKRNGKKAVYKNMDALIKNVSADSPGFPRITLNGKLTEVRQMAERYELQNAYIALEQAKMAAEPCSEEADFCAYCQAILRCLEGEAAKAAKELEKAFEVRFDSGERESAARILFAGLQCRIFLGQKWFDEERELIEAFVDRAINEHSGLSVRSVGMALYLAGDYYRLLAYLRAEEIWGEEDRPYREYLLAAACKEVEKTEEMTAYLTAVRQYVEEQELILPALCFFGVFQGKDAGDNPVFSDQSFREGLRAYRKAYKKNHESSASDLQQSLTVREAEITEYLEKGMSNKEIASQLNISENTVKACLKAVFRKLGITSRKELQ